MSPTSLNERFELLAAVGEVADGTLSLEETVHRILDLIVPAFADLTVLDALGREDQLQRLGVRISGPEAPEQQRALMHRAPLPDREVGLAQTVQRGESQLLSPLTDELLRSMAKDEEDLRLLQALELRSSMFVPLQTRGRVIGAFSCGVGRSGRTYDQADLRFAQVLSGRIALALDNAGLSAAVGDLERQLQATLENLAEAVMVRSVDGHMVFTNAAAARLLGFASPQNVAASSPAELMALYDAFDEQGNRLDLSDLPSARAQKGERPPPMLVRNVVRATGEERWLLHKATPVLAEDGTLSMVINVVEDVSEVKRAELAQRLLAEAGKELSSSLDYEQTLQRVAQLAVPGLADWCGVSMRGSGDVLQQVAVAHVDPEKVALARAYGERYPSRLSDPTGAAEVIRSSAALLVPEVTEEMISATELEEEQRAFIRDLEMRSVIIVPLAVAGRPAIGAMTLVMAESGRTFDEDDLVLAEELARRAATAVENARLYTERSRIAATLQRSLLPPELPAIPGFRLASFYQAAGEENEVGGDFYDAFEIPGGWLLVVGDVAGRGAEAAALTSLSRYTLRTAAKLLGDPLAAVERLNEALRERPQLSLVSVCCVMLRTAGDAVEADVVLAGHPPAYRVRGEGAEPVGVFAPFLGVADELSAEPATVRLEPGDQLVLYTDGVIDAVGEHDRFGEERLARTLSGAEGASDAVRRIDSALDAFAHGRQVDDMAVLVVERVPGAERSGVTPIGITDARSAGD